MLDGVLPTERWPSSELRPASTRMSITPSGRACPPCSASGKPAPPMLADSGRDGGLASPPALTSAFAYRSCRTVSEAVPHSGHSSAAIKPGHCVP